MKQELQSSKGWETLEPAVGERIRTLRERQGLSLRALAARCGLSANAISLIERGENSPTVSSLHLLANALGVTITDFFQDEQDASVVFISSGKRLRSQANGITMESLGIGLRFQQLEPFLVAIEPGAGNSDEPITHAGEEFVYCIEGAVDYAINSRVYRLEAGSSLVFEATQPHCFQNVGAIPARLIMVFHAGYSGHLARRLHLESPQEAHR